MKREMQTKALSGETRLEILRLLASPAQNFNQQWSANPAEDGVCMSLIAEALGVAQPTVTRHIDILRQADFVSVKKMQRWTYCVRNDDAICEYFDWLRERLAL